MDKKLYKDIIKILTYITILIFILFNYKISLIIIKRFLILILPFIIGISIAFILNVILNKIEKIYKKIYKKNKLMRPLCLSITLLILFLIIIVINILVIPQVIDSINIISNDLDKYINSISNCLSKLGISKKDINNLLDKRNEIISYLNINKYNNIDFMLGIVNKISNIMFNIGIGLVFAIYILLQKEKLSLQFKKIMNAYINKKTIDKINRITKISNKIFSNFIGGQFLDAIILGILCFIGMLILRIPYALLISFIILITALIPMFGALIGTSIGVLFIIIKNPIKAIIFIIYIIVLQQIEGNIIYPKVVGKTIGLPGIWVIVAVTIGISLFGIIGMIISVPITSIIYSIIKEDVNSRLKLKVNLSKH